MQTNKRNWNLNRRTVLKGFGGVTLGLPWMETMLWGADKKEIDKNPLRIGVIYQPNGINPFEWTPEDTGSNYKLSKKKPEKALISRLTLHCEAMDLWSPCLRTKISIESPIPRELERLERNLQNYDK